MSPMGLLIAYPLAPIGTFPPADRRHSLSRAGRGR